MGNKQVRMVLRSPDLHIRAAPRSVPCCGECACEYGDGVPLGVWFNSLHDAPKDSPVRRFIHPGPFFFRCGGISPTNNHTQRAIPALLLEFPENPLVLALPAVAVIRVL